MDVGEDDSDGIDDDGEEVECGGEDVDDDYYGDCGGDGADDDQNCFMWRTMVSAPPLCVAPRVDSPPDIEPHQRSSSQSSICLIPFSQTLPRNRLCHNHR